MARVIAFDFPLPNGLHARPASALEQAVRPLDSTVHFLNRRTGRKADGRSVLALVSTETGFGDPCELTIAGGDEEVARGILADFLARTYPGCDEPVARPDTPAGDRILPRSLLAAGLDTWHAGRVACAGIGWGRLRILPGVALPDGAAASSSAPHESESARFREATRLASDDLERELAGSAGTAAAILGAHAALLRDPAFAAEVAAGIEAGASAPAAVAAAAASLAAPLRKAESARLRERVADLEDVAGRVLARLGVPGLEPPRLEEPTIVAAASLAPSLLLALDRDHLKGLVLGSAGATSHAAILARSFGIPTLAGLDAALPALASGDDAIVDGNLGILVVRPPEGVRRHYRRQQRKLDALRTKAAAAAQAGSQAVLEVGANVASAEEIEAAAARGADGVGLFRTELAFLGRTAAPGEEEQFRIYSAAVRAARGRPLIIRTLDIGGDKPAPFLNLGREANPFLGVRGVRWYRKQEEIIKSQLRALARAAAEGPLSILVPMIAEPGELRLCRRLLDEARDELRARGAAFAERIPVGAMLEVPSAAFAMDELCEVADFFSLGTNDLAQYFFAADRENPAVADPKRCFDPAFLRLVRGLAEAARGRGRWIGLCGEWAEDPAALPLFVGLGLDEISVAGPRIPSVQAGLRTAEPAACKAVLEAALRCKSADEVLHLLRRRKTAGREAPLTAPELIVLDSDCRTKEEAVRELADTLHLAGRTDAPEAVEAAVWERERTYSTGFGDGFALPHAKTNEVSAASLAVLRLRHPVPWASLDGRPVDVAALLVLRADDPQSKHLAAMGRFSRLLMREEFRERLRTEAEPERLAAFISENLRPEPAPAPA